MWHGNVIQAFSMQTGVMFKHEVTQLLVIEIATYLYLCR
jgi:hypothetical protein